MQTPLTERLVGAYLHQDFDIEYDEVEDAVEDFIGTVDREAFRSELTHIDEAFGDEASAEKFWDRELGLDLDPRAFGTSYRDLASWLLRQAT